LRRREEIDMTTTQFDVTRAGDGPGPVVIAGHPAETLGTEAAGLLAAATGAPVVCVNPRLATIEQMAEEIESVRRAEGVGPVVFWGMSAGAWIGLAYARRHPHALRGLILESPCACLRARLADPACVLSPMYPAWRSALTERGLIEQTAHDHVAVDGEWVDIEGVGSVFRRAGGPALFVAPFPLASRMIAALPALLAFDARPWLHELRTPALVIAGTEDQIAPPSHARALATELGAELAVVDGAGHVPVSEGRPEVTTAVRAFMAGLR
jgi:pimeloyl-ACP methyl ester carboxylesterase